MGTSETVPAAVFGELRVFYPSGNGEDSFVGTGAPFLQSWPYDEEEWRSGFSDKITSSFEDQWTCLMVEKGDVRRTWPFGMERNEEQRTGLPGRPGKAKHLIENELLRRASEGRLAPSLAQEADELLTWPAHIHIGVPRPTPGITRNNIRDEYRRLKESTK